MFKEGTLVRHWQLKNEYYIENIRIDIVGGHYQSLVDLRNIANNEVETLVFSDLKELIDDHIIYLPSGQEFAERLWAVRRAKFKYEIPLVKLKGVIPYLECSSVDCMHTRECAQHKTAGDWRAEDGMTPKIRKIGEAYMCTGEDTSRQNGMLSPDMITESLL